MAMDTNEAVGDDGAERTGAQGEKATDGVEPYLEFHRVNLRDHPNALQEFLESVPGPVTIEGFTVPDPPKR